MKSLSEKLEILKNKNGPVKIMIMGLGSVGSYLLDYLMSSKREDIEIIIVGRNMEKIESDVNIIRIASLIRRQNRTKITIDAGVNFDDVDSISTCFNRHNPDIIVNSSRAYAGLKYGSISWKSVRAYGIWTPLSIRYIKKMMEAYKKLDLNSIIINTSYSDATIAWLKSAGMPFPDFGSGNINHLIPRIKYAISEIKGIDDYWNIDITYATAHFHDVVISKEGQTEDVPQLIVSRYNGKKIDVNYDEVFKKCNISMPTDAKRNMMNASSNYEIICGILSCIGGEKVKLHIPGAFGEIGGYPVILDGTSDKIRAYIDESEFSIDEMRDANRKSIYLDGVEDIKDGSLIYTDDLLNKVKKSFNVDLVKCVKYGDIDQVSQAIVDDIIKPTIQ